MKNSTGYKTKNKVLQKFLNFIYWRLMKPISKKYPEGKEDLKKAYKKFNGD